jgi:hypothetical protein
MARPPSFWFGSPKEELSATARARLAARRDGRLEQHLLQPRADAADGPRRPAVRLEARDPQELSRGVEVQELSESAYGRLFPAAGIDEDVDD